MFWLENKHIKKIDNLVKKSKEPRINGSKIIRKMIEESN